MASPESRHGIFFSSCNLSVLSFHASILGSALSSYNLFSIGSSFWSYLHHQQTLPFKLFSFLKLVFVCQRPNAGISFHRFSNPSSLATDSRVKIIGHLSSAPYSFLVLEFICNDCTLVGASCCLLFNRISYSLKNILPESPELRHSSRNRSINTIGSLLSVRAASQSMM